jgi:hypothetical protein
MNSFRASFFGVLIGLAKVAREKSANIVIHPAAQDFEIIVWCNFVFEELGV